MSTPANPDDLLAFLRAALDEDERVARAADSSRWLPEDKGITFEYTADDFHEGEAQARLAADTRANQEHIALHDPARVLAEVDAKRRIMAIHRRRADVFPDAGGGTFDNCCDGCGYEGICDDPVTEDINDCPILRALALPFAAREGFREEWRA